MKLPRLILAALASLTIAIPVTVATITGVVHAANPNCSGYISVPNKYSTTTCYAMGGATSYRAVASCFRGDGSHYYHFGPYKYSTPSSSTAYCYAQDDISTVWQFQFTG